MNIPQEEFEKAISLINKSQKILLVSHRRPDGDTLGATIALYETLSQLHKKTTLACIDDVPVRLKFLPHTNRFVREFVLNDFDLIIICDAGAYHMTGFHEKYPDFLSGQPPIINIDHHASNERFGTVNLVDTKASSATVVVWRLLKLLPIEKTQEMAIALLTGIYNDTGGFIHANTTKETFEVAYELAKIGINVCDITRPLFKQSSISQLKLWGFILEHIRVNEHKVLSSVVSEPDFKTIGAHPGDTGGIIDCMNTVPDMTYAILLTENEGFVKGSLRTQRDDVNLSDFSARFGGGGHPKASGFRVPGRLEKKTYWTIVSAQKTA